MESLTFKIITQSNIHSLLNHKILRIFDLLLTFAFLMFRTGRDLFGLQRNNEAGPLNFRKKVENFSNSLRN